MKTPHESQKMQRLWETIPWSINGTLLPPEEEELLSAIENNKALAAEYGLQETIKKVVTDSNHFVGNKEIAMHAFLSQLNAHSEKPKVLEPPSLKINRALAATVIIQLLGLSTMGGALWLMHTSTQAPVYHTMTAPSSTAGPAIRVVLATDMSVGDLQRILHILHLQIVDGPSESGVYTLTFAAPNQSNIDSALKRLRTTSGIRFAEAITPDK